MGSSTPEIDRYTIITSDSHAGADLRGYKPYLASGWHQEFEEWAATFKDPYDDRFLSASPECNWDSTARRQALDGDGVVAEVIFPNTVPPFYPNTNLLVPAAPSSVEEYRRRWAGLKAHNRWLADFAADLPGRRAGVAQILLDDIDDALGEIRWIKEAGLTGGILMQGVTPGSSMPGLWSEHYEPIWQLCEELEVPVHNHAGGGGSIYSPDPVGQTIFHIEAAWLTYRGIWHLIFGGVFERHPRLRYILTENGAGWVPGVFEALDALWNRYRTSPNSSGGFFGHSTAMALSMSPREYFDRNCYVGASFLHRKEAAIRYDIGVDRIMWGSDFPHHEGTYPYSTLALRATFANVPPVEVQQMLAGNAAQVYGFDLTMLAPIAAEVGPLISDVAQPLEDSEVPKESVCNAFDWGRTLRFV